MTDLIERLNEHYEDCRTGARVRKAYETLCHERGLAAAEITRLQGEVEKKDAALRAIKFEALTGGAPGKRTSAAAFAHIVRLCIDAGVTDKLKALGADRDQT